MFEDFIEIGITPSGNAVKQKLKCPKCSNNRKNKTDKSLSVHILKGLYNCHYCGWKGNVKIKEKKEFVKPVENRSGLSKKLLKWFDDRAITESTLTNWKITESKEYFAQNKRKRSAINFNYYRDLTKDRDIAESDGLSLTIVLKPFGSTKSYGSKKLFGPEV